MVLLEHNNTIYMGDNIIDSLANPIQCEDNDVRGDSRPKVYDPNNNNAQSINFSDGASITVEHDVVLACIAVRKTIKYKVVNCEQIDLTSKFNRDPYGKVGSFSKVEAHLNDIESVLESFEGRYPILDELSCLSLEAMISHYPVFCQSNNTEKKGKDDEDMNCIVGMVRLSLDKLSRIWGMELKTTINTLDAKTHQCISSTGLIAKRFKTDKSKLLYKKLSRQYVTLYVEYLKVGVKSARQFIGVTLYHNKLGFMKIFQCSN